MASTTPFIHRHVAALGAATVNLGVLLPSGTMIRRLGWSPAAVDRALPWLRAQNAQGAQIFVRPSLDAVTAVLVDDIPTSRLSHLTVTPAAIVETSPGNTQVWVRFTHPVPIGHARAIARTLQAAWGGDPSSADGQHFGRLVGFTNRWPRHRQPDGHYPLVRLLHASDAVQDPAALCAWSPPVPAPALPAVSPSTARTLRSLAAFHADPRYAGDCHRADLAWAVAALRHGWSAATIAGTIARTRDLHKKGNADRQQQYLDRTIAKARQELGV